MEENQYWLKCTKLLAPLRIMLVNLHGKSIVANEGHNRDSELEARNRRKRGVLGKLGQGWAGVSVANNARVVLSADQAKALVKQHM